MIISVDDIVSMPDDKRISEIMEVSKHLIEVQEDKEPAKRTRKKVGED